MLLNLIISLMLGSVLLAWGLQAGNTLVRKGSTADNLFKGQDSRSLIFLGLYLVVLLLVAYVPQMQIFPLKWRFYGMRTSWTLLRMLLLGACGVGFAISWRTARMQVIVVLLVGLLGLGGFSGAEAYFLSPIYPTLADNLLPNGVFKQTSNSSCAPAALATLLRLWNISTTESTVARLADTSRVGTSMPQLIVAARALEMDGVELTSTWEQMQQINRPGILGVWLFDQGRKLPHAVTLIGLGDRTAIIADPARGRIVELDRSTFEQIWRQQYVPIFSPSALDLSTEQVADYLQQLGYLQSAQPQPSPQQVKNALRRFQQIRGLAASGNLDRQTALWLSGPFLRDEPTLSQSRRTLAARRGALSG